MPDTTNRPTPEQIADDSMDDIVSRKFLTALAEHGYVIVHPDDVPERNGDPDGPHGPNNADGWNACRARIFGGSQ